MTEEETLRRARMYMDKLSAGINPLDDSPIPAGDVAANERLRKCFAYVAQVLTQALDEPTHTAPQKRPKRSKFYAECVDLADFPYSAEPLTLGEITARINDLVHEAARRRLPVQRVYQWLCAIGMLERRIAEDGKPQYLPTEEGRDIGFAARESATQFGRRTVITCTEEAQGFIVDNIEALSEHRNRASERDR